MTRKLKFKKSKSSPKAGTVKYYRMALEHIDMYISLQSEIGDLETIDAVKGTVKSALKGEPLLYELESE